MLKCTPAAFREEIDSAETIRDLQLSNWDSMRADYLCGAGSEISDSDEFNPENHAHEWLRLRVPQIVYDNPRVSCTSLRPGEPSKAAMALEHGLNRWVVQNKLRRHLMRVCYDQAFAYGVLQTSQEPVGGSYPGDHNDRHTPVVKRIPPHRFLFDPMCLAFDEARWAGHMCAYDKDDLIDIAQDDKKSGWNLAMLKALGEEDPARVFTGEYNSSTKRPERRQLIFYEVWVPEKQLDGEFGPEEGFHGTIYTLCYHQGQTVREDDWVRESRPFYGPRWGPYSMFGVYLVPDSPYPLSPLLATRGQQIEVNAHAKAASIAAQNYKKLAAVDAGLGALINAMLNSPHHSVVPVEGLFDARSQIAQIETGGVTPAMAAMYAQVRERYDRAQGTFDAERGVTQGGTATESAIADEAATTSMAMLKSNFNDATTQTMLTLAYYLALDERNEFPLGREVAQKLNMYEPWFKGGAVKGSTADEFFDSLELVIDPYSMPHESNALQQARAAELLGLVGQIAPLMPQTPWVRWKEVLDDVGDMTNRDLGEKFDFGMLEQITQTQQHAAMMQMQQAAMGPPGQMPQRGAGGAGPKQQIQRGPQTRHAGPPRPGQRFAINRPTKGQERGKAVGAP